MSDCLYKAVKLHPQLYFTLIFFEKCDPEIMPWPFTMMISLFYYRRDGRTKRSAQVSKRAFTSIEMEGCLLFILEIFTSVWFRRSLFQMSLEVPIKCLFYIYARVFLQFTSPSLSSWVYALLSSLPLLDVCHLLPVTLFKLSCTYFHSFLTPKMLLWFICFCFSFQSGSDQQRRSGTRKSALSIQFDADHS